mmetsp:Transcript_62712/g.123863  ORF Transcript_62712/g.123863 Transcript_62712/m.123863 type:complete len:202 (+) Transcript_62712:462-1067(+)
MIAIPIPQAQNTTPLMQSHHIINSSRAYQGSNRPHAGPSRIRISPNCHPAVSPHTVVIRGKRYRCSNSTAPAKSAQWSLRNLPSNASICRLYVSSNVLRVVALACKSLTPPCCSRRSLCSLSCSRTILTRPLSIDFCCESKVSSSISAFFLSNDSFVDDTLRACSSLFISACRLSDEIRHASFFFSNSSFNLANSSSAAAS